MPTTSTSPWPFHLLVPLVVARRFATVGPAASQLCPFFANLIPDEPRSGLQKHQSLRAVVWSGRHLARCPPPRGRGDYSTSPICATASDASGMSAIFHRDVGADQRQIVTCVPTSTTRPVGIWK